MAKELNYVRSTEKKTSGKWSERDLNPRPPDSTLSHAASLSMSHTCSPNNLEQVLPFWKTFLVKYRLGAHIKHEKVIDFQQNFNLCGFLERLSTWHVFCSNTLLVPLIKCHLAIFSGKSLRLSREALLSSVTDVSNYFEQKASINVYIKEYQEI